MIAWSGAVRTSSRAPRITGVVLVLALALGAVIWSQSGDSPRRSPVALVSVSAPADDGTPIPPGFVGLSLEFKAVRVYTGPDAAAVNPVLLQLIRNLTPGQRPSLRIGGNSTDRTWWPVPGVARPAGINYTLSPSWLQTTGELARDLHARMILGVNLAIDNPGLAGAEARALVAGIGPASVAAFEIGNEPDVYGQLPRYRPAGRRAVRARRRPYNLSVYTRGFSSVRRALPSVPVAGPSLGGPRWLSRFILTEPRIGLVTFHRYPMSCYARPGSAKYPTLTNLLNATASTGLAATVAPFISMAHARGEPFRVDELNSVSCAGKRGVSDTFGSALWVLDTLFAMAHVGVDGVNIHTLPGARYQLFSFTRGADGWRGTVYPEYYGLLMFAQAAPAGSRLVPVTGSVGPHVTVWATRSPSQIVRVVVINKGTSAAHVALVRPAGTSGTARLERLLASGAAATSGITLGGETFGSETSTGMLAGARRSTVVHAASGRYELTLPPMSAALLTL
jgi:hypothetical protein